MKIFVFGHIGSGKSLLIDSFCEKHTNYEKIKIDDYRKKYFDKTWKGENIAQKQFVKAIDKTNNKNQIIEATGWGRVGEQLKIISITIQDDFITIMIKENKNIKTNDKYKKAKIKAFPIKLEPKKLEANEKEYLKTKNFYKRFNFLEINLNKNNTNNIIKKIENVLTI